MAYPNEYWCCQINSPVAKIFLFPSYVPSYYSKLTIPVAMVLFRLARAKRERDEMIEAKKREMSQQLAELEDGSDGPDEFEGNINIILLYAMKKDSFE